MYRFCRIGTTNLICYRNGTILRFHKKFKKWTVCFGSKRKDGYLEMRIDKKLYLMHRVIAHAFKILDLHSELMIDHINFDKTNDKSNNCIFNLRPVNRQQNGFNTSAKGFCRNKRAKKWIAQICLDGKRIYLGYFDKEEDARNAYLNAKKIYHII
jgi:hypothetical protein